MTDIKVKILSNRKVEIPYRRFGGTQGDTGYRVEFDISDIYENDRIYRVEWYGAADSFTQTIPLEVKDGFVYAVVPNEICKCGGTAKAYLVEEKISGNEVSERICTYPIRLYFNNKPTRDNSIAVGEYERNVTDMYLSVVNAKEQADKKYDEVKQNYDKSVTKYDEAKENYDKAVEKISGKADKTYVDSNIKQINDNQISMYMNGLFNDSVNDLTLGNLNYDTGKIEESTIRATFKNNHKYSTDFPLNISLGSDYYISRILWFNDDGIITNTGFTNGMLPKSSKANIIFGRNDQADIDINDLKSNLSITQKYINALQKDDKYKVRKVLGKNLFNPETKADGFLNRDGTLVSSSSYVTSDFIEVSAGKTYIISPRLRKGLLFNKSKQYIQSSYIDNATTNATVTPTVDGYLKISVYKTDLSKIMVEEGSEPTAFEEYGYRIEKEVGLGDKQKRQVEELIINQAEEAVGNKIDGLLGENKLNANNLYGKTIANFGDSIAYGASGTNYAKQIAAKNNMTVYNKAVGGATVRVVEGDTNNVLNQINNYTPATTPDFVLINGLTNDAYTTVTGDTSAVGKVSNGFSAELDTSTFCGAFETILKTAMIKYRGAKIIYITTHINKNRDYNAQKKLTDLAIQICEKWGVTIVDMFHEGGLNSFIDEHFSAYINDGSHPNTLGYATFYVPMIESKMKALAN